MKVLVDGLVASLRPDLISHVSPNDQFDVFDPFASPAVIRERMVEIGPDVIVVDTAFVQISFLLLEIVVSAGCRDDRVVVASGDSRDVMKVRAMRGGFVDLIDLGTPVEEFVRRLHEVHEGGSRLRADRLWRSVSQPRPSPRLTVMALDAVDVEILDLITIGLSNEDIAAVVHMAVQTVRNRVSAMLQRSEMSNRTELAWTYRNQMLTAQMVQALGVDRAGRN